MEMEERPRGKRYRKMDTISHVFAESDLNHRLFGHEGFQFFLLQKRWKQIVGPILSKESYISSYKGDTLFVTVTNSSFMQQLYMVGSDIVSQLQKDEWGKKFQHIRFVSGPRQKKYKTMTSLDPINGQIEKEQKMYSQELTAGESSWISKWVDSHVRNETIRKPFADMMEEVLKIRKGEIAHGFHPCPLCGSLCSPEQKICPSCERKVKKNRQNRVILLLKEKPYLTYQEVRQIFPCDYSVYENAREILIHRYKENIFRKFATEEEKRKLLSILLHKPVESITKEEAQNMLSHMPQKWWK